MKCPTCGKRLRLPLVSISHTIMPGENLCPDCGNRETLDPAWASGMRVGILRNRAGEEGMEVFGKYKARKERKG